MNLVDIVEMLAVAGICAYVAKYYLHMMQLESYQTDGYKRWLAKHREKAVSFPLNIGVIATIAAFLLNLMFGMVMGKSAAIGTLVLMVLAFGLAAYVVDRRLNNSKSSKPIVYTPRMKRLYGMTSLLFILGCLILVALGIPSYLAFSAVAYVVLIAAHVLQPIEKRVNDWYLEDARRILGGRDELIKIGITGSFGKTSTKVILATILREKYNVYATPASFNTPMGLTRNIREELKDEHEVFVAEMGARHVGDIKELCELVRPKYGAIVSVGEQHLETFGDVSTVAKTKFELIESLPSDGVGFFAADDGQVDQLYQRATCEKYRAGIGRGYLYMYAEGVEVGAYGSRFLLCESVGERIPCETKLLGTHNIENIVLASAVARRLGLTMEEIAHGIKKIEPVEHRLQLIRGAGNMLIIDDAFNSNPVGAKEALNVLSGFGRRRVIVTPGMVEQGEREADINREFGRQMATKCDVAILVGTKRTRPIYEGLIRAGFEKGNIRVVENLDTATAALREIGKPGDVVLFENDLPDNYNE